MFILRIFAKNITWQKKNIPKFNKKIDTKYQKVGHPNEVLISAATELLFYNGAQIWQQIVLYEAFKANASHGIRPEIEFVKVKDQFRFDLDRRWTERSPAPLPILRFALSEMFQRNASKFDIFYV